MIPTIELTFHDIVGAPWEGRAVARFQGEPGQPFTVREGVNSKQREDIRWYIEDYMELPEVGNEVRAKHIEQELQGYGKALWQGLQAPELLAWLGAVQVTGKGRLELRAAEPKDEVAFSTPWELMRVGGGTLLHQLGVTVVRRSKANLPNLQKIDTGAGLRILTVICRPEEAGFIDPRYTPEAILNALDVRPEVSIDFCRPGTLVSLVDMLQRAQDAETPYHVLHFDGHGTTIPSEGGIGALCFEQQDGRIDFVRASQFGDLMARFHIPLVVLEACRSAMKYFAQETVASSLLRHGVGTVIAMGNVVHIDMTRELMSGFYGSIARGSSLGEALQAGRNSIYANKHRRIRIVPDASTVELNDWFVPQLYQSGDDPVLLSKKPAKRKPKSKAIFAGFVDAPRAGFQGRGHEIHRLERILGQNNIVILHAPGGLGKTALSREASYWWTRTGMFPDGAIFVSLEGNPSPKAIISKAGEALEGIQFYKRQDAEAWLEEQFRERRMLIVWDNYESVLPAFNGGAPTPPEFAELADRWTSGNTRLLVTCRNAQVGLSSRGIPAWPFALGELLPSEGLQLLFSFLDRLGINRAERARNGWTIEQFTPIIERTGGHPLAIELLAPEIAKRGPQAVIREFSTYLAAASQEAAESRNRNIKASLEFSIRHLSEKARTALPAVGLIAGGFPEKFVPIALGFEEEVWVEVRQELEQTGLLRLEGMFIKPHPVLSDIQDLRPSQKQKDDFLTAILGLCTVFHNLILSEDAPIALKLFQTSDVVVRRAMHHAVQAGAMREALYIAKTLHRYYSQIGREGEGDALIIGLQGFTNINEQDLTPTAAELVCRAAFVHASENPEAAIDSLRNLLTQLQSVKNWDTRFARADVLQQIARIYIDKIGKPAQGLQPLQEAIPLYEQVEQMGYSNSNRSAALGDLAHALMDMGRFEEALSFAQQSLDLGRQRGDSPNLVSNLHRIGEIYLLQGHLEEAEKHFREALERAQVVGDHSILGHIWQKLGVISDHRDFPDEAFDYFQKAYFSFQTAGNEHGARQVMNSLGIMELWRGNVESGLAWFNKSLQTAVKMGDLSGQAHTRMNLAEALRKQVKDASDPKNRQSILKLAIENAQQALILFERLERPKGVAAAHLSLGFTFNDLDMLADAEQHAQKAVLIQEDMQDEALWKSLKLLEIIANSRGDESAALEYSHRTEAAYAQAQGRAGSAIPQQAIVQLFQLAIVARGRGQTMEEALAAIGADENIINDIDTRYPWLACHLRALAHGDTCPEVAVPPAFKGFVEQVWENIP